MYLLVIFALDYTDLSLVLKQYIFLTSTKPSSNILLIFDLIT